ncbi:MAG: MBOAT family O-acyltransferase [Bacillota bacterium]
MLYMTWFYLLFVATLFFVYWFVVPARFRPWVFAAGSAGLLLYVFPGHTLFVFALATVVYLAGEYWADERLRCRNAVLISGIVLVLGVLFYFKYSALFVETFNRFAGAKLKLPEMALPLGISYFSFRFVSYLIDVKRGVVTERSYGRFLLYTFFFPIMPAGPIERYGTVDEQSRNPGGFRWDYVQEGIPRILWGLFKKIVLADSLSFLADDLSNPGAGSSAYWVGMYAATMKIYLDFSGYTDMAVGTSRLFGYRIMENFNNPYLQPNISLFWKNWHISLTRWFRDYLFIPLGGSRRGFGRTVCNTALVWAATGIWHGAAWHFLFWGLYHAVGLVILRLYNMYISSRLPEGFKSSRIVYLLSTTVTFHFVAVGWIFFFVDVKQGFHVLKVMAGF